LAQREFGFVDGCTQQVGERRHGVIDFVAVDQPAPQRRLLRHDGAP
jgi:hypothetical protein